jgi:hypothetical protein
MTKDEIIELAVQAGMYREVMTLGRNVELLTAFAKLVAQQEAKDEPVAWIKRSAKGNIYDLLSEPDDGYEPVYTTPPQRKPLTDEEIYLCTNHIDRNARGWANEFARAIEAAHGIKDNT